MGTPLLGKFSKEIHSSMYKKIQPRLFILQFLNEKKKHRNNLNKRNRNKHVTFSEYVIQYSG